MQIEEKESLFAVAPFTGAWIEMPGTTIIAVSGSSRTLHGCVVPVWLDTPVECTDLLLPRFETAAPNLNIRVAPIPHGVLGKPVPSIHIP